MKNPEVCIIAALSEDRAIGKDNQLLWRIPEDLRRFRALTLGHPVIMGRRTFDSIGRALPQRTNLVISRNPKFLAPGCSLCSSLEEALFEGEKVEKDKLFVIGGGQIYEQALSRANRLYLTLVEGKFEGDTFFPDYSEFKRLVKVEPGKDEKFRYKFLELER